MELKVVKIDNDMNLIDNVEKCMAKKKPFSITTKGELDYWLLDCLASNSFNDVHLCLNTLDEDKWYRYNDGCCSSPLDLIHSAIDCFNNGIYVYFNIEINKETTTKKDVFQVVDRVKNWVQVIELKFIDFEDSEKSEYVDLVEQFVQGTKASVTEI